MLSGLFKPKLISNYNKTIKVYEPIKSIIILITYKISSIKTKHIIHNK